ncbi:MAG: TonB family protein [Candidatus Sumerlaeota bacterium]|nr:TonB family protein [Candidatus Sumerlaeota bacterium]
MFKLTCYSAGVHALIFLLIAAVSQIQSAPAKLLPPPMTIRPVNGPPNNEPGNRGGNSNGNNVSIPGTPKPAATNSVIKPATPKPTIAVPQPAKEPAKTATPKTKDPTPAIKKTATPAATATPPQPSKVIAKATADPKKVTPTPAPTWAPPVPPEARTIKEVAQAPVRPDANALPNRATPAPTTANQPGAGKPGTGASSAISFGNSQGNTGNGLPGAGGVNDPNAILLDAWWVQNSLAKILDAFKLPKSMTKPGVTCELVFTINRAGLISDIQVLRSSGDSTLNDYAVKALKDTEHLPPLPETVKENILRLTVTFDFGGQQ